MKNIDCSLGFGFKMDSFDEFVDFVGYMVKGIISMRFKGKRKKWIGWLEFVQENMKWRRTKISCSLSL